MAPLDTHADSFQRHIDRLDRCAARIEEQLAQHRVSVTDVELVYTSAFLSICARWESFLEESLVEVSCGPASRSNRRHRHAEFRSRADLRRILLFPDKDYVSFPSLHHATNLAALFVSDGRPFNRISEQHRTFIQQAGWIRNAIAHQSKHALRVFRDKVPGVSSLVHNRRQPGPFLRAIFRQSPTQRRYEIYFTAFKSASDEIVKAWK